MTELELCWLAGVLEGEGSFSCIKAHKLYPSAVSIQITMDTTDEDVARRVRELIDANMGGPYERRKPALGKKPHWAIRLSGDRAKGVMQALYPHMGIRRKAQIDAAITRWDSRPIKHKQKSCRVVFNQQAVTDHFKE